MIPFIENQNWRYATKKYDISKKISDGDLNLLKEAMQMSVSSYGLQPYTIFIVEDKAIRQQLQKAAWGQSQIVDASHLIIFANVVDFNETHIDNFIHNIANTRNVEAENIKGYGDFMKSKLTVLPLEQKNAWTSKQTYLALGNLLNAAAELKIDATPMEGFDPEAVNEILGLKELGLNASLIATIGYRDSADDLQFLPKVRKSKQELFITL